MKTCTMCKESLPFDAFNKNAKRKDGLQSQCRECWKAYYKENYYNRGNEKARLAAKNLANRLAVQQLILESKNKPCMDCGHTYPSHVMDFDHLRDKTFTIARFEGRSLAIVQQKIDKCDVVCSNCHRERTWQRRQH